MGQMKKYQATIDYLTQENEGLKEKVKEGSSIKKQLEAARLKQENEQLRRFVQSIPQELLHDLRGQGRGSHSKDQQR